MNHTPDKSYMQAAIDAVKEHMPHNEGGPFGACIVKNGKIISIAHNSVLKDRDPTCHAEVNAIRQAAKVLNNFDLSGCSIYSTTEPCPMCFSAIHWANIGQIIYGTEIADVNALGFNELTISNVTMKKLGNSPVSIVPNFEREPCQQLLTFWQENSAQTTY